jgi:hypothetical protein
MPRKPGSTAGPAGAGTEPPVSACHTLMMEPADARPFAGTSA